VFIPELGNSAQFAGLSLLDESWVLNPKIYDGILQTMWQIANGVAYNWSGAHFRQKDWIDYWLVVSLQKYIANLFIGDRFDA
jgi:hypothetical protein